MAGSEPLKPPVSHNQQSKTPDQLETPQDPTFMKNQTSAALSQVDESGSVSAVQHKEDEEYGKGDDCFELEHNNFSNMQNSDR